MKKPVILFILIFLLIGCNKTEDSVQTKPLQVLVFEGLDNATILWQAVDGFSETAVEYSIYMSDSLVAGNIKERSFKISDLLENTFYNGRIEAYSAGNKIAEQSFEFTTLQNQPPGEFDIYETAIRNNAVSLKWNKAIDPENTNVVYDIYINNILKLQSLNDAECEIQELSPNTAFSGEIAARDSSGNIRITKFSVKTLEANKSILVHRYIEYQGYKRDFAYYIPTNYDSSVNLPLVINLHGANGNAWKEIGYSYFKTVADRENFILMMPQALLGSFGGETIYQWNAHYLFTWDDVSLLNYLLDYMYTRYHVDLSKIYLTGMSNGGFMTFFAARPMQERLAAIAPISGLMSLNIYTDYKLNRPMPLCYIHGTADPIVKIDGYPSAEDVLALWANNNTCTTPREEIPLPDLVTTDNSTVTLFQYHGYTTDSEIQYYRINGGGHSVPGIETGANMDINAYEVIWSFFKRHSYPAHAAGNSVILN
jgi:polyhydroxybutyrate depolymerase